ncbi:MAG: hypothetical protein WBB86_06590 [Candidatus Omnitrophota bacterium]
MKPRKNYRTRPKKKGAKRKHRIKTQRKRLVAAGLDEGVVFHMTEAQVRKKLMEVAKKIAKGEKKAVSSKAKSLAKAKPRKKPAKKTPKKTVKKAVKKPAKKTAKKATKAPK